MPVERTKLKKTVYRVLNGNSRNWLGRVVTHSVTALILLSVIGLIFETVNSIHSTFARAFFYFELISVSIFSLEYLLRVWSCTADPNYVHPVKGRLKFIVSPLILVDLLAVLPFYFGPFIPLGMDLRALRTARLIGRSTRLGHHSDGMRTLLRVLRAKSNELLTIVVALIILLTLSSALMYYVENNAQPDKFSSIPATAWWGIVTLTTVGYGDMAPVTALGRVIAGVMAILGIGLFALPAGILGSGFMQEVERKKTDPDIRCPKCGERYRREIYSG